MLCRCHGKGSRVHSTLLPHREMPAEAGEGPSRNCPNRTNLAAADLVPTSDGCIDRGLPPAFHPQQLARRSIWPASPTDSNPLPPTCRMEGIRRRVAEQAFCNQLLSSSLQGGVEVQTISMVKAAPLVSPEEYGSLYSPCEFLGELPCSPL